MGDVVQIREVLGCKACGAPAPVYVPVCPECKRFHTIGTIVAPAKSERGVVSITDVEEDDVDHISTGIGELDRVLGGGIVPGAVCLLSGEPGCGKSTLLLQMLASMTDDRTKTLYITGEESLGQVGARASRLDAKHENLMIVATSSLAEAIDAIQSEEPVLVVVDSVQTLRSADIASAAGTGSQLKEVTERVIEICKSQTTSCFLVGHVTKDGIVAGPKTIEHLVDTTLTFEGDEQRALRILRAGKNRNGPSGEIGVFEMIAGGLREVDVPSARLMGERAKGPGSVVVASCEGPRALLVEVQALVGGPGKELTIAGLDKKRIELILALLKKDILGPGAIYASVAGGMRVTEPGMDLGVVLALVSARFGRAMKSDIAVFGEVGLAGEVRGVGRAVSRLTEAASLGFKRAIVPISTTVEDVARIKIEGVGNVWEAIEIAFDTDIAELLDADEIVQKVKVGSTKSGAAKSGSTKSSKRRKK